jgi:hemoglobin/transferrin/lactoferrin receptor protein
MDRVQSLYWHFAGAVLLFQMFFYTTLVAQEKQPLLQLGADDLKEDTLRGIQDITSVSRSRIDVNSLPVTVYIVTREEILSNGFTTLTDALKSVPEIKVSQPGNGIQGETFLIRGLNGNYYTKILLNGMPLQPTATSGMPIASQLPIRQAERIEIILGPSSAVYGSDAVAGVINIVTHSSEKPVYVQSDIAVGSQGQEYLNLLIGGKLGKGKNVFSYSIFGAYRSRQDMNVKYDIEGNYNPSLYDSSGAYVQHPFYRGDSLRPEFGNLPNQSRMLGFDVSFRGLKMSVLNSYRRDHSSIGQSPDIYTFYDPSVYWGEQINQYTLRYEKEWRKIGLSTYLSYLMYRLDNQSSFGLTIDGGVNGRGYKYAASDDIRLEQVITYRTGRIFDLTGGAEFQYSGNLPKTNDLASPFDESLYKPFSTEKNLNHPILGNFGYNPFSFWNLAGYLQLYFKLKRLNILVSGRLDYHSIYDLQSSPRIAMSYRIRNNMSLRLSAGSAFRAPSSFYTYSSLAFESEPGKIFYDVVPNPGLKEENLLAAEAGYKWEIRKQSFLEAIVFYHRLNNQITRSFIFVEPETYPDAENGPLFSAYVNDEQSEAELIGLQINTRIEDVVKPIGLDIELMVSLSQGREVLPSGLGTLENYRQWPQYMGQVNITLQPLNGLYLFLRNTISGKTYRKFLPLPIDVLESIGYPVTIPGYYTLDILARYNIGEYLQVFLRVNNVLGAEYGGIDAYGSSRDLLYNPQYGRYYNMGLTFTFD